MSELFFLPDLPPAAARLPWYALLLLAAAIAGEAVQRWLRLPRLLGWIAVGAVLGPHALGALDAGSLDALRPVLDVAIGVVLFELGQRVDLSWVRRNPWLLGTSVLESALGFALMFAVLLAVEAPPLLAAAAAAIGIATAPAVVLTVTRELRAQGQVAERALLLTALNSVYAVVAVSVLLAWLAREYAENWRVILLHPLYLIFGSLALAAAFAAATLGLLRLLGRRHNAQFLCVFALVVIAVWVAATLRLSVVLTLLGFGAMARMLDRRRLFVALDFGRVGSILLILLFSITAANIEWAVVPAGALVGGILVAARLAGKALGVFALAPASGLPVRKASLLTLALAPMSGIAVVLVQQMTTYYPQFGPSLATVVVSAIAMLELLGPLLMHFALVRAGEAAEEGG
ncbi:MAG: cation:proton antiporter [Burkholderiales bacterium]